MMRWLKPALVFGCLVSCVIFSACAPNKSEENFLPGAKGEFQKVAVGSWRSGCSSFSENDSNRSEIRSLQFSTDSALSERFVYNGRKCAGEPLSKESATMDVEIKDVAERDPGVAVLELTNQAPQDFSVYRTLMRVAVDKRAMTTSVLKMSYWERGSERWVPEYDIDSLTVTTYTRQ